MRALATVLSILVIVASVLVTESIMLSRNTMTVHPEWVLGKRLLSSYLMGTGEAEVSRTLLHRNRLNLNTWHGHQEILLNRIIHLQEMKLRFALADDADLSVLFNKNRRGFAGVRLSRGRGDPMTLFWAQASGRFETTQELGGDVITDGWHELLLTFTSDRQEIEVYLDQQLRGRTRLASDERQVVGFRGGRTPALVDDVEVRDATGAVVIRESFENSRSYGITFLWVLLVISSAGGVGLLLFFWRLAILRLAMLWMILVGFTACTVLGMWYVFDHYWWSNKYLYEVDAANLVLPELVPAHLERARRGLFGLPPLWAQRQLAVNLEPIQGFLHDLQPIPLEGPFDAIQVIFGEEKRPRFLAIPLGRESVSEFLRIAKLDDTVCVLLLGSSQFWGEGARARRERIDAQLFTRLAGEPDGPPIVVVNGSLRGGVTYVLEQRMREGLALFEPDIVLVDLSFNDEEASFGEGLVKLIAQSREAGAKVFFFLEAAAPGGRSLESMHRIMRETAEYHNVEVRDLHGFLHDKSYVSGFVWWDGVHLTSWGQELAAEFTWRNIREAVITRNAAAD